MAHDAHNAVTSGHVVQGVCKQREHGPPVGIAANQSDQVLITPISDAIRTGLIERV